MRTCVRVARRQHPARRPGRVLRVGRAARRPAPARAAGDRRRRRGARGQLRGEGAAASARAMGGRQARRLCPDAIVVPPRMSAYTAASRAVFEIFRHTTPLVEGLSIDEAFLDVGGLRRLVGPPAEIADAAAPGGARAGRPADHGGGGPHQVPGQGGQRGGQAGRPAGGRRRTASWRSCTRCRSSGCGASARSPPPSCASAGSAPSARWPRSARPRWCRMLGAGAGRHLHALAHNRDPRPVQVGPAARFDRLAARAGPQRRTPRRSSTPSWSAWSTGSAGRMRAAGRVGRTVVLRLRFDDFTRATRSHTLRQGDGRHDAAARRRARRCCAAALPDDRSPWRSP